MLISFPCVHRSTSLEGNLVQLLILFSFFSFLFDFLVTIRRSTAHQYVPLSYPTLISEKHQDKSNKKPSAPLAAAFVLCRMLGIENRVTLQRIPFLTTEEEEKGCAGLTEQPAGI